MTILKSYSPCILEMFPILEHLLLCPILGVFRVDFCLEHFSFGSRDVFHMFLNILIFDPKWRFCKGYSPCIIVNFSDFRTLVILWIVGVFGVDFYLEHFCFGSRDVFRMFLNILSFHPKWRFCKGYGPCIIANFSDFGTHVFSRIVGVFGVVFCLEHFCCCSRDLFRTFLNSLIFDLNWRFCKGYSPCIIAKFSDLEHSLIFVY